MDIQKEEFVVKPEITSKVIFARRNFITGATLFGMDLVLCQNVLPALKRSFQIEVLQKMTVALREKGALITEGDTVLPKEVEENFSGTGEVGNCIFELVKRGDVGKYLGQAEVEREIERSAKYAKEMRAKVTRHMDRIKELNLSFTRHNIR